MPDWTCIVQWRINGRSRNGQWDVLLQQQWSGIHLGANFNLETLSIGVTINSDGRCTCPSSISEDTEVISSNSNMLDHSVKKVTLALGKQRKRLEELVSHFTTSSEEIDEYLGVCQRAIFMVSNFNF